MWAARIGWGAEMAERAGGEAQPTSAANLDEFQATPPHRNAALDPHLDPHLDPDLLERALDATGDGVLVRDTGGTLLWANEEATRQLGLSIDELRRLPADRIAERYEIFDAEGQPFTPQGPGLRALMDSTSADHEILLRIRDRTRDPSDDGARDRATGEERWAEVRARQLRNPEGQVLGSVTAFRDVTEYQQARAAREVSDRRLRLLASLGPRLLATSLDAGGVLELMAELVVPAFADYCSVREVDADGSMRRVAVRHADPANAELVHRLEEFPPWSERLISASMLAGRTYLAAELDPELLADLAVSDEHRKLLDELGPRSLVAVPVIAKGQTVGTLAAVNAGSGRCFGPDDVVLFEDLARRAGLAIENALLFEKEHLARAQAERARSELGFLLEASTLLASTSLDFSEALQRLSRLAASTLCDLCLIDLLDAAGESITRVAATTADPALQPLADQLRDHFAPLPSSDHPAARVMATGTAESSYDMEPEFLRATTRSVEHRRLVADLQFRSYICVPLAASGRILGALTLVATAASRRRYEESDLALAADLARRASLALDNARLFQEAELQKALLASQSEATIEGALVVSPDGRIVSYNRQLAEMWSVPAGVLESGDANRLLDWVSGQVVDPAAFRKRALQLQRERQISARDQIVLADGRVFDRWSSPLVGGDGANYGRAFYFRDVTDLKQVQQERVRLYEAERAAHLEAETSRARLQILLEATTILSVSMDPAAALSALGDLVVRHLADACVIDLVGDPSAGSRIGRGRHVEALSAPGNPLAPDGVPARVVATGEPLLVPGEGDGEAFPGVASYLGVPLVARGRILGCLSLVSEERRYSHDDLVLAQELGRRAGIALDHVRLFDAQRHIAMTLQRSLLPPKLPAIPGIELAARYRPALEMAEVGGDFYDVFAVGGGAWALAMGDISGKGVEAAALTSLARYTVRAAAREHRQPREILSLLNDAVMAEGPEGRFLTVAFGRLRQQAGGFRLTTACGGHPLPLLLRADGTVEQAARPGTLIGFVETVHLPEKVTELAAGDLVVFYTDGLTDVRGPEGTFGEERLAAVLGGCQGLSADSTAARLEEEVLAFLHGEPRDDLAMLVLRVSEG